MSVALISNIPAPYRIPVFEQIVNLDLIVIFCAKAEENRRWTTPPLNFKHLFLQERVFAKKDGFNFIHNNFDIWQVLSKQRPRAVITTGFYPTHLYAFSWARANNAKHICMTDGTVISESNLSLLHRITRRIVFSGSHAFIAASNGGVNLYKKYGIAEDRIFRSQLCANNEVFFKAGTNSERRYDVCFSGQFHERKLPFFFVDVCAEIKARTGSCSALLMGDGPLRERFLQRLKEAGIKTDYAGFVQQCDLPSHYASAKVLLFPTLNDAWGVVANEALAAGTPVVTTPYAGVAHELVVDGETGYVRDLDTTAWADVTSRILSDDTHREALAAAGKRLVSNYNFKAAAEGIEAACRYVQTAQSFA